MYKYCIYTSIYIYSMSRTLFFGYEAWFYIIWKYLSFSVGNLEISQLLWILVINDVDISRTRRMSRSGNSLRWRRCFSGKGKFSNYILRAYPRMLQRGIQLGEGLAINTRKNEMVSFPRSYKIPVVAPCLEAHAFNLLIMGIPRAYR